MHRMYLNVLRAEDPAKRLTRQAAECAERPIMIYVGFRNFRHKVIDWLLLVKDTWLYSCIAEMR
jgi:hypothetical protein